MQKNKSKRMTIEVDDETAAAIEAVVDASGFGSARPSRRKVAVELLRRGAQSLHNGHGRMQA